MAELADRMGSILINWNTCGVSDIFSMAAFSVCVSSCQPVFKSSLLTLFLCICIFSFFFELFLLFSTCDGKRFENAEKMFSTSKSWDKHPSAGQNTQQTTAKKKRSKQKEKIQFYGEIMILCI